ncbi:hypothetical protein [Granulicella sp. L60]|uniref:hypothetical protein n=1 Tax=Granulicella sp. L60 TaxID=1641866 RepID=UPI00131B236B|nr:hypothetical protein [Granulicella sp. L60]
MSQRTAALFLLTAACFTTCAAAQTPKSDDSACPVNILAQRQSAPAMLSASSPRKDGPSQGLHVILTPTSEIAIESLEVTLHGLSPNPRVLPIKASYDDEVTKAFDLHRRNGEKTLTDFDVWMSKVGALRWLDVTSITYADGTRWSAPANAICRAIPTNLLLIGQR